MLRKSDITIQSAILDSYSKRINATKAKLSESEKSDILFQCALQFIIRNKWKYDGKGHVDHSTKILRLADNESQTVNCHDLSNMFIKLCKKVGMKNAAIINYRHKPSKLVGEKYSSTSAPLKCFDSNISFPHNQSFFDLHSAVKCNGKFYDLTFSTSYHTINEPYDVSIYGQILSCIYSGNELLAIKLLESNQIDLSQTYQGLNLLHAAAACNLIMLAEKLIQLKPELANQKSSSSAYSPNQAPIETTEVDSTMFELLKKYTDNEIVTEYLDHFDKSVKENLLQIAMTQVEQNDLEGLSSIIESGDLDVNSHDLIGHTLLHQAALFERHEIYNWLLDNGANSELKRKDGNKACDFLPKQGVTETPSHSKLSMFNQMKCHDLPTTIHDSDIIQSLQELLESQSIKANRFITNEKTDNTPYKSFRLTFDSNDSDTIDQINELLTKNHISFGYKFEHTGKNECITFIISANTAHAYHLFAQGIKAEKNGSYAVAIKHYQSAIEMNFDRAKTNLGTLYADMKLGMQRDLKLAFQLLTEAAMAGYPRAQYNLALLYELGEDIKKDLYKARFWYSRAANNGIREANNAVKALNDDLVSFDALQKGLPQSGISKDNIDRHIRELFGLDLDQTFINGKELRISFQHPKHCQLALQIFQNHLYLATDPTNISLSLYVTPKLIEFLSNNANTNLIKDLVAQLNNTGPGLSMPHYK